MFIVNRDIKSVLKQSKNILTGKAKIVHESVIKKMNEIEHKNT